MGDYFRREKRDRISRGRQRAATKAAWNCRPRRVYSSQTIYKIRKRERGRQSEWVGWVRRYMEEEGALYIIQPYYKNNEAKYTVLSTQSSVAVSQLPQLYIVPCYENIILCSQSVKMKRWWSIDLHSAQWRFPIICDYARRPYWNVIANLDSHNRTLYQTIGSQKKSTGCI